MKLDQLNTEVLKEVVKIAKEEGVSQINLESKDFKLSVKFPSVESFSMPHKPSVHQEFSNDLNEKEVDSKSSVLHQSNEKIASSHHQFHEIKSPFVGTFYASPAPDKPPYVKVGERISIGQALCVLEAMKIMNEIDSDVNGEIVEVCVDNESLVEYGQTLFKIRT